MKPGTFNLDLYRGDSYVWQFKLWDDAAKTDPTDLTGVTVNAQIRPAPTGLVAAVLDCTITMPNIIDVALDVATWTTLTLTSGKWDLELTYATGEVSTVVAGSVTVTPDVTSAVP